MTAVSTVDRGGYRALAVLLRPYRGMLALAIFFGVLDEALALGAAGTGAYLVGKAATGASAESLTSGFVLLAVLVLPKPATAWIESFVAHDLAYRVLVDLRIRIYAAIERTAPAYLLERRSGDVGSIALGDVELVELFFAHTLGPMVVAIVVPLGAVVALFVVSPLVAVALVPALVLVASIPSWLRRTARTQGQRLRAVLGVLSAEVVDRVQGLREVLMFGQQRRQLDHLDRVGTSVGSAQRAHARRAGTELAVLDAVTTVGLVAVLAAAASVVANGTVDAAAFPFVVVLAGYSFIPLTTVIDTARELGNVAAAGRRITTVLDARPVVTDPAHPVDVGDVPRAEVAFDDVTFRYEQGRTDAVRGVTFAVPAGSTVALVGHSGAGKSTCAALLLRWWDPAHGSVRIGDHDVRSLRQSDLHRLVSLVPQDTYLFNMSVADNIRLARPDASDADVQAAASRALAHDFVTTALADGYDTVVGERGAQLSGGQRQRIAIARALLADAPVLILDEAVSNVDAQSEAELDHAMAAVRSGRTTVVIAHRHSTIRSADTVIVLSGGRVVDAGTDAELLDRSPVYRALLDLTS